MFEQQKKHQQSIFDSEVLVETSHCAQSPQQAPPRCFQEKFLNDAKEAIGAMMNTQVEAQLIDWMTGWFP